MNDPEITEAVRSALTLFVPGMKPEAVQIMMGAKFIGNMRTCKLIDVRTGLEMVFIQCERRVRDVAASGNILVVEMESYRAEVPAEAVP